METTHTLTEGTLLHTLNELQKAQGAWQKNNEPRFGVAQPRQMLWGVGEEFGEFQHALLKREQGIRGTHEEHTENMADAIGDMMVYLCGYANASNVNLAYQCVEAAYAVVDTDQNFLLPTDMPYSTSDKKKLEDEAVLRCFKAFTAVWEKRVLNNQIIVDGVNDPEHHDNVWRLVRAINCLSMIFCGNDCITIGVEVFESVVAKRNWVANAENGVVATPAVIVPDDEDEGKEVPAWESGVAPAGVEVYTNEGCTFNYCPHPEVCKGNPSGCVNKAPVIPAE